MSWANSVVPLKIELTDIITPKSCSYLIAELIKYIAYNKQQIPYPYERLKLFVLKRRKRKKFLELSGNIQGSDSSVRVTYLMEKYFKKVEEAFEILETTFKCIEELLTSHGHPVQEIVLSFGATPVSPKDVYRVQIPSLSHGHSEGQHLWKRQIGNLFRELIVSDEVNANIQRRVGLTNMFVMLKMKEGGFTNSDWLLPKDHYRLTDRARQVCFSFISSPSNPCTCSLGAGNFEEALSHNMTTLNVSADNMVLCEKDVYCNNEISESDNQFVWFQAQKSLKGFRDCKSQGKSITDLWFKHSFIS